MKPKIMAHRGASKQALENTISAFKKAIECNSDYIELDVRVCKTGELIVFHDKTGKRLLKKRWSISKMPLSKIKQITLPNGEHIPTLEEALSVINNKININIEMKVSKLKQEILQELITLLKKFNLTNTAMISSFCHPFLKELKKQVPTITTAALFIRKRDLPGYMKKYKFAQSVIKKAQRINADAVNMKHNFITKKLVKLAHEVGIEINAWTVDNFTIAKKMFRLGIDGLITNKPKTFISFIKGAYFDGEYLNDIKL